MQDSVSERHGDHNETLDQLSLIPVRRRYVKGPANQLSLISHPLVWWLVVVVIIPVPLMRYTFLTACKGRWFESSPRQHTALLRSFRGAAGLGSSVVERCMRSFFLSRFAMYFRRSSPKGPMTTVGPGAAGY